MSNTTTVETILTRLAVRASAEDSIEALSYAAMSISKIKNKYGPSVAATQAEATVSERMATLSATSLSIVDLSYGGSSMASLEDAFSEDSVYTIGKPGELGFGVSALYPSEIPAGWSALPGHDNPSSANYGNYMDPSGSHMVFIRKYYIKRNPNNVIDISANPKPGYALHEAFRHSPIGVMRDKSHVVNVGGVPVAKLGLPPLSTASANNPISALNGAPTNTYAGMVTAIKLRGAAYYAETVFVSDMLAMIGLAHSQASPTTAFCAWRDVSPFMPKGNNNNALADADDSSVKFISAGNATYPSCAKTGSGVPFAKTTHNGQPCGVADVNGNMWRVNIGLTKLNNTNGIFKLLKTTVNPKDLSAANLHDAALYDDLDLTALIPSAGVGATYYGNGVNQVFADTGDADSVDFRAACATMPLATGVSASGTSVFGDYLARNWVVNLVPVAGGAFSDSFAAGAVARHLGNSSANSHSNVGGAACVSL